MAFRILALLVCSSAAWAASAGSPQFLWDGDVDQTATLSIRGDQLRVTTPRGGPVERQRWRFFAPLADSHQEVRLEVRAGRGSVRIAQQPALANNYMVEIQIEDPQDGRGHYSIALYWEADAEQTPRWHDRGWQGDSSVASRREETGKLTWHGHVEGDAIVECSASFCKSEVHGGMPVSHERVHFTRPLPASEVAVSLENQTPYIRVLEQPLRSNGYKTRVEISDECGGNKDCSFTLFWREPDVSEAPEKREAVRGMVWSARVSGTVRVTVRGSSTVSEVLNGGPTANELALFDRPLPHESGLSPAIRTLQGRGTVAIIETPSEQNGFTLLFEVRDPGPGADDYAVELDW
jgi:hypothetical protein